MLSIKNSVSTGDIVTCKLATGEEWVTRLVDLTETTAILGKPMQPVNDQQGRMMLVQAIFTSDSNEYPVSRANIITMVPTQKEIADHYTQATTGIQVASGKDERLRSV